MKKQEHFMFFDETKGRDSSWESKTWIERLIELNGYPCRPIYTPQDAHWSLAEKMLKVDFPGSFKELLNMFGSGHWGHIELFSPHPEYRNRFTRENVTIELDYLSQEHGLVLFPEKGGLLPFATTRSRIKLCWDTSVKDPNEWPVVLVDTDCDRILARPWSVPQMIYSLLKHNYTNWPHCSYFRSIDEFGNEHDPTE